MGKIYFVYILTNKYNNVFYVGFTDSLSRRVGQHKVKFSKSFTSRYNINKLVYYEIYSDPNAAIRREKLVKRWKHRWKENIIEEMNPEYKDLMIELPLNY